MKIIDSVVRITKLGLFVGWGVGLTIWGACSSSTTTSPDTIKATDGRGSDQASSADKGTSDKGASDARATDTGAADASATDQQIVPDTGSWDIPLE